MTHLDFAQSLEKNVRIFFIIYLLLRLHTTHIIHITHTAITPAYVNPCIPSPCGPYSQCREINLQAVCSCLENYIGSPPHCHPECVVSSECPLDKACVNQKCVDPCPGVCGQNARCNVRNHSPICTCSSGFTGDPFVQCHLIPRKSKSFLLNLC